MKGTNLLELLEILIKGGPLMMPLLACSIIALAIVIERILFWRRIADRRKSEEIISLIAQDELSRASELSSSADSPITRVLASGLAHKRKLFHQSDGSRCAQRDIGAQ